MDNEGGGESDSESENERQINSTKSAAYSQESHSPKRTMLKSDTAANTNIETKENTTNPSAFTSTSSTPSAPFSSSSKSISHIFALTKAITMYLVAMFLVYFCQYSLQSGVFSGIGFPITSEAARKQFYSLSNWAFQIGLCIGRCLGNFLPKKRFSFLWMLVFLQALFFTVFSLVAISEYNLVYNYPFCLPLAFAVGLVGGSTYCNALTQVSARKYESPEDQGTSISILCISESFGCICADFLGLAIQGCLYELKGISGATFQCKFLKS